MFQWGNLGIEPRGIYKHRIIQENVRQKYLGTDSKNTLYSRNEVVSNNF